MTKAQEERTPDEDEAAAGRKRALLVGVRSYPFVPEAFGGPLAGCHNDVARMREILLARGFCDDDLAVYVDRLETGCDCPFCSGESGREIGSPTRDGILAAVAELTDATGPDDLVVFYYSGHGSEFAGRNLYAGQRFQTIVPVDSGRGDRENRDIADREIEGWIRGFSGKTPYLTLIFDCCHSGGMTDLRSEAKAVRTVRADEREDELAYAPELRKMWSEGAGEAAGGDGSGSVRGPSGWLRGGGRSAVVLSASAAKELSSETVAGGRKQGLFTTQLHRVLGERAEDGLTWADVFEEIAGGVTAENLSQHPRREGNSPIFERGEIDPDDVYPPDVVELEKLAVVIGCDYDRSGVEGDDRPGFPALRTPKRDAEEVARVLGEVQGFEVVGANRKSPGPLLNEKATRRRIHKVIDRLISIRAKARRETAVVIYFAGHGVTRTTEGGEHAGYLVPWEADPDDPSTWLPMKDLRDHLVDGIRDAERLERLKQKKPLSRLTSRHLLLVLDCCFGGAMSFDFFRGGGEPDRPIYYSEYKRFVEGTAWQMLTSASFNQQAMDRNPRDPDQEFSPFAQAVIDGLTSAAADSFRQGSRSDHIVTAAELHQFVDTRLKSLGVDVQTPGLTPLRPLRGQFIFHVPGFRPTPLPDPPLDPDANPWPGVEAYAGDDVDLFFGREPATLELLERFLGPAYPDEAESPARPRPAIAVAGPSGSGKTSLVQAGLLPILDQPARERRRLQAWARRSDLRHLLVSRPDLKAVRDWAAELSLDLARTSGDGPDAEERSAKAGALADGVRGWARRQGLLDAAERDAARIQADEQMKALGVPSFEASADAAKEHAWVKRLGLLELLDRPGVLAERLALWCRRGGLADFMSVPDRALAGLVGRWTVVTTLDEARVPAASDPRGVLLVIDGLERRAGLIRQNAWRSFAEGDRARTLATVRSDSLARDPDLRRALAGEAPRWELYRVPRPAREDLLQAIQGPASARALVFSPAGLAERLIEEVESAPAPLPLLASALARTYERAWERRRDADRELRAEDLGSRGAAGVLSRRAEDAYQGLKEDDPKTAGTIRDLFRRAVSLTGERPASRPITWRELELAKPPERRRLEERVLPALLRGRVLVTHSDHLELATRGLIGAWPRLRRWVRDAGEASGDPHALWHRAREWEESEYDRGKLWTGDRKVLELLRSPGLNRLEQSFVVASDMQTRSLLAGTLASFSPPHVLTDWQRSAALAVEVAQLALDTREVVRRLPGVKDRPGPRPGQGPGSQGSRGRAPRHGRDRAWAEAVQSAHQARSHSRHVAEQTLQHALEATPLSVPLSLPGEAARIAGLGFHESELRVRLAPLEAGEQRAGEVLAWDLGDLSREPRALPGAETPEPGAGGVAADGGRGLAGEYPIVSPPGFSLKPGPRAQAGHDKAVRYFPQRPRPFGEGPTLLLGHRAVPTFLAFSEPLRSSGGRTTRWLASAANLPTGAEVRLWPIDDEGRIPSQPVSLPKKELADVFAEAASADAAEGPSWRLESLAEEGSSIVLRDSGNDRTVTVELPRTAADPDSGASSDDVTCVAFNPQDGAEVLLAAGTRGGTPYLVGADFSATRPEKGPSQGETSALAFSPDGRRLAIGGLDGRVCLLEASLGKVPPPVILHADFRAGVAVSALAFDSVGKRLAVERRTTYGPRSHRVDVYRLDLEELAMLARGHAGRGLEPGDLPPDLRDELFGSKPGPRPLAKVKAKKNQEKKLYLAALLEPPPTTEPKEKT